MLVYRAEAFGKFLRKLAGGEREEKSHNNLKVDSFLGLLHVYPLRK